MHINSTHVPAPTPNVLPLTIITTCLCLNIYIISIRNDESINQAIINGALLLPLPPSVNVDMPRGRPLRLRLLAVVPVGAHAASAGLDVSSSLWEDFFPCAFPEPCGHSFVHVACYMALGL